MVNRSVESHVAVQAALCVEEIIEAMGTNGGTPFVTIIERRMKKLLELTNKKNHGQLRHRRITKRRSV